MRSVLTTIISAALAVLASAAFAHDGGHEEAPVPAASNAPKREPDGKVFLPKASQRQLAILTQLTETQDLPRAVELAGRVVMDANAGGKVQPTQAGRIEAGPKGLPVLGQAVRKGEVLALVRPSASAIERANQTAQAAELQANLGLARQRVARLTELEGSVPRKEIEAAQAELRSLTQRSAAVTGSLSTSEALRAPVSGVIAAANVVAGQVVDARELLFEIVDPTRLRVEAIAHDLALAGDIAAAAASVDGGKTSFKLAFVGAGRTLREQALPVLFSTTGGTLPSLAVGQALTVVVQTRSTVKGVAVPASALVKNPGNQDIVWVHTGAERFEPRSVRYTPLDGASISVLEGLKAGERVVVQGASLVNQVR